jgi:hypothetical protein
VRGGIPHDDGNDAAILAHQGMIMDFGFPMEDHLEDDDVADELFVDRHRPRPDGAPRLQVMQRHMRMMEVMHRHHRGRHAAGGRAGMRLRHLQMAEFGWLDDARAPDANMPALAAPDDLPARAMPPLEPIDPHIGADVPAVGPIAPFHGGWNPFEFVGGRAARFMMLRHEARDLEMNAADAAPDAPQVGRQVVPDAAVDLQAVVDDHILEADDDDDFSEDDSDPLMMPRRERAALRMNAALDARRRVARQVMPEVIVLDDDDDDDDDQALW